jgi:hypothetical protein
VICHVYPVPAGGTYQWKWRSEDGKRRSSRAFELFYDCVEDARSHGNDVDVERAHQEIAGGKLNLKFVSDAGPAVAGKA